MIAELVLGTVGAVGTVGGIGALVFWRKRGNGKHLPPDPTVYRDSLLQQQAPAQVQVQWPPELAAVLTHITERLETSLQKVESASTPWTQVVGELERVTKRVLVASRETKPEWAGRIENDLAENDKRLERIAADLSENMANGMARFYSQLSKDLAGAVDLPALVEISDKLEAIVDAIPEPPQPELTIELTRQLADLPARIGRSISDTLAGERKKNPPPPAEKSKGNDPAPPPKAPPKALPPLDPKHQTTIAPLTPASYVAGQLYVPGGEVWSLLYLIQKLLNVNCPGTSASFMISASGGSVLVGTSSPIAGPLSEDNYAYMLDDDTPPHFYRSSFPGNDTPVGELQVFSTGGGYLHVEVQS